MLLLDEMVRCTGAVQEERGAKNEAIQLLIKCSPECSLSDVAWDTQKMW